MGSDNKTPQFKRSTGGKVAIIWGAVLIVSGLVCCFVRSTNILIDIFKIVLGMILLTIGITILIIGLNSYRVSPIALEKIPPQNDNQPTNIEKDSEIDSRLIASYEENAKLKKKIFELTKTPHPSVVQPTISVPSIRANDIELSAAIEKAKLLQDKLTDACAKNTELKRQIIGLQQARKPSDEEFRNEFEALQYDLASAQEKTRLLEEQLTEERSKRYNLELQLSSVSRKPSSRQPKHSSYVVLDFETTGLSPNDSEIIEVAMLKISGGIVADQYNSFVNPEKPIPPRITQLTGIKDSDLRDAPTIEAIIQDIFDFIGDNTVIAHNASFDLSFLAAAYERVDISTTVRYMDTLALARKAFPDLPNHKLCTLTEQLELGDAQEHRALSDVMLTNALFQKCIEVVSPTVRKKVIE